MENNDKNANPKTAFKELNRRRNYDTGFLDGKLYCLLHKSDRLLQKHALTVNDASKPPRASDYYWDRFQSNLDCETNEANCQGFIDAVLQCQLSK